MEKQSFILNKTINLPKLQELTSKSINFNNKQSKIYYMS